MTASPKCKLTSANNHHGIEKIDCILDIPKNQMVLMLVSNQIAGCEMYAFIQGKKLILEAPVDFGLFEKPVRTHLVGEEILDDYMNGDMEIGFSEIDLNPRYHYAVLSYQVLNPGLMKIVLSFKPVVKNNKNHIS